MSISLRNVFVVLSLVTLMVGCSSKEEVISNKEKVGSEAMAQDKEPVNKQPQQTNETQEKENKESLEKVLRDLKAKLDQISDTTRSGDDRSLFLGQFLEGLTAFLQTEGSSEYPDQELEEKLGNQIFSKTKKINGTGIRVVRYAGLPDMLGTLERVWTFIQWTDQEGKNHSQQLLEQGAEITNDFVVAETQDGIAVALTGYLTLTKPHPVFVSTWILRDNSWQPSQIPGLSQLEGWNVDVYENEASFKADGKLTADVDDTDKTIKIIQESTGTAITLSMESGSLTVK